MPDTAVLSSSLEVIKAYGPLGGLFILFFVGMHWWIHKLHNRMLDERQKEIDRLAEDNRLYRDRFLAVLDKQFSDKK